MRILMCFISCVVLLLFFQPAYAGTEMPVFQEISPGDTAIQWVDSSCRDVTILYKRVHLNKIKYYTELPWIPTVDAGEWKTDFQGGAEMQVRKFPFDINYIII